MAKQPARQPKSEFQLAAERSLAAFNKAREAERKIGPDFSLPDIADGEYLATVSRVELGVVKKGADQGKPFFRGSCVVVNHPDYEGTKLERYIVVKASAKSTEAEAYERVLNALYGMGYELPIDVSLAEIESLAHDIEQEQPNVRVRVKNGSYTKAGETEPTRTLNVDFIGPVGEEEDGKDPNDGLEKEPEPENDPPPPRPANKSAKKGR